MACGCNRRKRNDNNFMEWCFNFLCEEDEPVGSFCDVGYFYREADGSVSATFPFEFEAAETYGGVTFDVASPNEMRIANTGIYEISYFAKAGNANASGVGLSINGGAVISNTIYATSPDRIISGQAIIRIDQPNSILELISRDGFTLFSDDQIVASVIVEKVCELQN